MTILVSQPDADRLAYGFIQKTLDLTGGNLTTHLRKLEDADYLVITKEFLNSQASDMGTGDAGGAPRIRRVSLQPGEGSKLAASYIDHQNVLCP